MAAGVTLAVLGAILTFAVHAHITGVNIQIVGLIFMLAGGGLIWNARAGSRRERVITRVRRAPGPENPGQTMRETIEEHDVE